MEINPEKIYCMPSCQNNTAEMMALMNNQNNWNNNPFMYLIWLAFFGGGGFGGWGNRADVAQNADLSRQLTALQGSMTDNHNNDIALAAINGNRDALGQLAQTFNTDITAIQSAICSVKSAIEQVGGAVGYSAEKVINAVNLGDQNITTKIGECCCATQKAILESNYQNQLATERQTNILGSQMAANHSADQLQACQNQGALMSRIDQLANGIQSGFAQVGFQSQQNTQAIIENATANTQRILDQMCANTTQELRDKLADTDRQLQTQTIINQLKSQCGCNCG